MDSARACNSSCNPSVQNVKNNTQNPNPIVSLGSKCVQSVEDMRQNTSDSFMNTGDFMRTACHGCYAFAVLCAKKASLYGLSGGG